MNSLESINEADMLRGKARVPYQPRPDAIFKNFLVFGVCNQAASSTLATMIAAIRTTITINGFCPLRQQMDCYLVKDLLSSSG